MDNPTDQIVTGLFQFMIDHRVSLPYLIERR